MHTRRNVGALVTLCSLAVAAWLLPDVAASEEARVHVKPLAEMSFSASRVDWRPAEEHERLTLTVAGPGGLYIQREFGAGEAPFFSTLDAQDGPLPDGMYAYELRAKGREAQWGHLWLQGGGFMDKASVPSLTVRPGKSASKPPLSKTTANTTVPDELIVQGHACIGANCVAGDGDEGPVLTLKEDFGGQIRFKGADCCVPYTRSWALQANHGLTGDFLIRDLLQGTIPFRIAAQAPDNALTIMSNGHIGLGTLTPADKVHILESADENTIAIIENPNTGQGAAGVYRARSNSAIVDLKAHGSGRTLSRFGQTLAGWSEVIEIGGNGLIVGTQYDKPLILGTNSTNRIHIANSGNVGIGTTSPSQPLHVSRSNGTAKVLIEETSGTTTMRNVLELKNNGGIQLLYNRTDGTANDWQTSNFSATFEISIPGSSPAQFSLASNGNLTIAGTLTQGSDRATKTEIVPVQPEEVLAKLVSLPISTWSRKDEDPKVRHLGPMAQDFSAIFGLGEDDRHIAPLDMAGVSMASIQALHGMMTEKDAEIAALQERLAALEKLVSMLAAQEEPAP